jgi:hypothetical protein
MYESCVGRLGLVQIDCLHSTPFYLWQRAWICTFLLAYLRFLLGFGSFGRR